MQAQGDEKTVSMERIQTLRPHLDRLCINRRSKEVDRIPDAPGFQYPVGTGQQRHRHASCKSTFETGRDRVGFDRKPCTHLIGGSGNAFDNSALGSSLKLFINDGHCFFILTRKDFAEPPYAASQGKHSTEKADRCVSYK